MWRGASYDLGLRFVRKHFEKYIINKSVLCVSAFYSKALCWQRPYGAMPVIGFIRLRVLNDIFFVCTQ